MYISPSKRQSCGPFSVSLQLSCKHAGGSPHSHVEWQNCHSAQHSARSVLSAIFYLHILLSAKWWHQGVLATVGAHIRGPYILRFQSYDVSIVIALRWECMLWVCGVAFRYCYTAHTPSFLPCSRTCVGIKSCITLYHVDLFSLDRGVEAMFFQTAVNSAFGCLTRMQIKGKSCPESHRSA